MSSIRDALKRAERERQERRAAQAQTLDAARGEPSASEPSASRPEMRVVGEEKLPILEVPMGFAEELALFRHGVEAAIPKPRRSLVLSSASGSEGVTTVAVYLATSLAVRDGKKTLLVDANFKSPKVSRIFGLLGRPGFSDYCTGSRDFGEVLQRTDSPDLFLMGLGTEVYNPSLALSSDRARGLSADLTQRFDYVLFDTGSVLGNAETSMLSSTVDGVVLVVRANRTKREVLAKAEKLIRFSGGRVIGSVLNRRRYPIPDTIYKRL